MAHGLIGAGCGDNELDEGRMDAFASSDQVLQVTNRENREAIPMAKVVVWVVLESLS